MWVHTRWQWYGVCKLIMYKEYVHMYTYYVLGLCAVPSRLFASATTARRKTDGAAFVCVSLKFTYVPPL